MKNDLVVDFEDQLERVSPNQVVFSLDLMASTKFFAHPVTTHATYDGDLKG